MGPALSVRKNFKQIGCVAGIVLAGGTVPGEQSLLFFLEVEFSFCFRIPNELSHTMFPPPLTPRGSSDKTPKKCLFVVVALTKIKKILGFYSLFELFWQKSTYLS